MAGPDMLPWRLSLTPARLDDPYVRRLAPPGRWEFLPHAAGPHEVNEVTFVQTSFDVQFGMYRAPLSLGVGSRARLVGSHVSGLSPPFCSPKGTEGERPVFKGYRQ
jgi:hypothetical protein